jgi:hypothetical protein
LLNKTIIISNADLKKQKSFVDEFKLKIENQSNILNEYGPLNNALIELQQRQISESPIKHMDTSNDN